MTTCRPLLQLQLLLLAFPVICSTSGSRNTTVVSYTQAGVSVISHHGRTRREVNPNMAGFNTQEKKAMLNRHNDLRSSRKASDMMLMEWNNDLAKLAQDWAEKCIFEHSSGPYRKDVAGFRYVGENLYAGTHKFDPANVIQAWYNEIHDYDYATKKCTKICGHYTQVVWASSVAVGCGAKYCPKLGSFGKGYHVVCHYGPGGNYVGQRPFDLGDVCSKCPKSTPYCVKGLCSKRPQIGSAAEQMLPTKYIPVIFAVSAYSFCKYLLQR